MEQQENWMDEERHPAMHTSLATRVRDGSNLTGEAIETCRVRAKCPMPQTYKMTDIPQKTSLDSI